MTDIQTIKYDFGGQFPGTKWPCVGMTAVQVCDSDMAAMSCAAPDIYARSLV